MPNRLINASYKLTLLGHRLLKFSFTKVNHLDFIFGFPEAGILITAKEWLEVFNENENPYRDFKRASESLLAARVTFCGDEDSGVKIVDRIVCKKGEGEIRLFFSNSFIKSCVSVSDKII